MGEIYTDLENGNTVGIGQIVVSDEIRELVDFNNFQKHSAMGFDHYTIAKYLIESFGVPGDVVELGCHVGETSKILQRVIEKRAPSFRQLYVYDSFQGLPAPDSEKGDGFVEGTLKCDRQDVIENFVNNNLRIPTIVEGWFKDAEVLPEQICFAFFDGDLYSSIKDSFELIWDRVSPGGIIAVHDYHSEMLAGVRIATSEFLADKPYMIPFCYKNKDLGNDILIIKKS